MVYPVQTLGSILNSWGILSNLDHPEKQTLSSFLVKVVNKHHYTESKDRNNCQVLYDPLNTHEKVSYGPSTLLLSHSAKTRK